MWLRIKLLFFLLLFFGSSLEPKIIDPVRLPAIPFVLKRYGFYYLRRKKYLHAKACFMRLKQHKPLGLDALCGFGQVWLGLRQYRKAFPLFSKVIEANPVYWRAFYYRGKALLKMSRYGAAYRDFLDALALRGADSYIYLQLAKCALKMRRRKVALRWAQRSIRLSGRGWQYAGLACYHLSQFSLACYYFRQAFMRRFLTGVRYWSAPLWQRALFRLAVQRKREANLKVATQLMRQVIRMRCDKKLVLRAEQQLRVIRRLRQILRR